MPQQKSPEGGESYQPPPVNEDAVAVAAQYLEDLETAIAASREGDKIDVDAVLANALGIAIEGRIRELSVRDLVSVAINLLSYQELAALKLARVIEPLRQISVIERRAMELSEQAHTRRRVDMLELPRGSVVTINLYDSRLYRRALEQSSPFSFMSQTPLRRLELETLGDCRFLVLVDAPHISDTVGLGNSVIGAYADLELHSGDGPGLDDRYRNTELRYANGLAYRLHSWVGFTAYQRTEGGGFAVPLVVGDVCLQGVSLFGDININSK